MPIEEPVENFEAAVQKLRRCDSADLRRARQHHRRALEALQNGGYGGLSGATREHLVERLRTNLKALDHVLDTTPPNDPDRSSSSGDTEPASYSLSARFRAFLQAFWPTDGSLDDA